MSQEPEINMASHASDEESHEESREGGDEESDEEAVSPTSQKRRDILTAVPPEVLLKIITQVPTKNFLDLAQISHGLRDFVKSNASKICNEIIRTRFCVQAKKDVAVRDG